MYKRLWEKFLIPCLIIVLVSVLGTTAITGDEWEGYEDVTKDNAHYQGIKELTEQGVLSGYESNQFKPWENISRQHIAVILSKVGNFVEPENISETLDVYKDVDSDDRYATEIAMLTEAEVFKGDENDNFNPTDHITRQQMASVLVKALGLEKLDEGKDVEINLSDVSPSHKKNVQILANLGLTNQLNDFRAYEPISRAAVATLVNEAQSLNKEKPSKQVKPGIDVLLDDHLDWLEDKRVGLITNATGVSSDLTSTIDLLHNHPDINLTSLYGPEHGIRGDREAGEHVDSYTDEKTGLPVYSLYGSTWKPTEDMLEDVDVLLYDIQDIGSNVYTYIYTLGFAMEAAAEQDKELIVLDRPNPIGGTKVEGPVRSEDAVSFMGRYMLPVRHGMTVGELAYMWNQEYSLGTSLRVVEMDNWERDMHFEDTGLPWIMTSPNIPTEDSANLYAGTELLDDTSLSTGLGTTRPFEIVGAPWIDADALANEMNDRDLEGVIFRATHFTPMFGEYEGELNGGVQVHLVDASQVDLVKLGLNLVDAMRAQDPDKFEMSSSYTNLIGSEEAAEMVKDGEPVDEIIASWEGELNLWDDEVRSEYLLYPPYADNEDKFQPLGGIGILPHDLSATPGEEKELTIIGYDENGQKVNIDMDEVVWDVPDELGFVENGKFHAEGEGHGVISAKYKNYEASREVDVSKTVVENIRHAVHSDYTRVVFDLNKTASHYEINEDDSKLEIKIPLGEISGELNENGETIEIEESPALSSIEYKVEDDNFIAVLNLNKKQIEYETPEFSARLVIDLQHE